MSNDGRRGAARGGVPGLEDGVAPLTGVRVVRVARLRDDSSFRVERLVRFSERASLFALILAAAAAVAEVAVVKVFTIIGSTPLD